MADDTQIPFRTEGQPVFPQNPDSGDSGAQDGAQRPDGDQTPPGGEQTPPAPDGADKGKGFADDPAWKERETTWDKRFNDQEVRHQQALQDLRKEFESRIPSATPPPGAPASPPTDPPEWFGGEAKDWQAYTEWNQSLIKSALESFRNEQQADVKRVEEAQKHFQDELAAIEADKILNPEGIKIDEPVRNKLLKIVDDFKLATPDGHWNYRAAWAFLRNQRTSPQPANTGDRQRFAGAAGDRHTETPPANVTTSEDFLGKSWGSL